MTFRYFALRWAARNKEAIEADWRKAASSLIAAASGLIVSNDLKDINEANEICLPIALLRERKTTTQQNKGSK